MWLDISVQVHCTEETLKRIRKVLNLQPKTKYLNTHPTIAQELHCTRDFLNKYDIFTDQIPFDVFHSRRRRVIG